MTQNHNHTAKGFTLLELLVAMGVLVLMMGFLFQFIIGAQRVWSSTTKQSDAFASANTIASILTQELQNLRYSDEKESTLPFYAQKKSNGDITIAFYTDFTSAKGILETDAFSQVGTYPVIYYYDKTHKTFYRCALDRTEYAKKDGTTLTLKNLWYLCGADYSDGTDFFDTFKEKLIDSGSLSMTQFDALGEEITDCEVTILLDSNHVNSTFEPSSTSSTAHYADAKPVVVKFQFTAEEPAENGKQQQTSTQRTFSQVILL